MEWKFVAATVASVLLIMINYMMPILSNIIYIVGAVGIGGFVYYSYWRLREISHPFNAYTTAEEATNNMDLTGKTAVVTGCNTGIGKETVRVLVKQGCSVYMACRSKQKAMNAKKDILKNLGLSDDYDKLTVMILDLSSLESVKTFANEFNKLNLKINYLINNAGVAAVPDYRETKDGIEMQFGINHLGHFYLTHLLMPSILRKNKNNRNNKTNYSDGDKPRIINVSSVAQYMTDMDYNYVSKMFDAGITEGTFYPQSYIDKYNAVESYALSKSCNILFSKELIKRFGNKIMSVSLHPGVITDTELGRHMDFSDTKTLITFLLAGLKWGVFIPAYNLREMKDIAQGAATTIRCVSLTDKELSDASFYHNCRQRDDIVAGFASKDFNGELASKLWQLSKVILESRGHSI